MRRPVTRQHATPLAIDRRALVFIAVAAAAIVVLCFRTWVDFGVAHLPGTDTSAVTGIGDGYFVAGLATLAVLLAAALILRPAAWGWLLPGIGICAVAIAAITAYDAGTAWHVAGIDLQGVFIASGHATAAMYEVLGLAIAIALVAATVAGVQYRSLRIRAADKARQILGSVVGMERVMIKRILVPLDGSGFAERALPLASRIAEPTGAELLLLSAVVPGEHWAGLATAHSVDSTERVAANDYLNSVAESLRVHGLSIRTMAVNGRPADAISAIAEEAKCDLIVMATQGRSVGLDRWIVGSVADKVRHSNSKPVLLVRGQEEVVPEVTLVRRILVPLDGSELAEQALPLAEEFAKTLGASLILEQVIQPPAFLYSGAYLPSALPVLDDIESAARAYLDQLATDIRANGVSVEVRADVGMPSQTIVDLADGGDVDMIVMMTHGRTGPGRFVMGSVADAVSRHASVACLIVPAHGGALESPGWFAPADAVA